MKKIKEFKPSKWTYVLFFSLALLMSIIFIKSLDNDIWGILSEGREFVENGIWRYDALSMHEGLHVVVQNWLSVSIFWIMYSGFGEMGIVFIILSCSFLLSLMIYKLCMLISDRNKILSLIIMLLTIITLAPHYIVARPQMMSFVILISWLYVLELYIKNDNKKYLIWLPILSILEVNLHASLWWMLFIFTIPYLIDSLKIPILKTQGYNKKWLFIFLGIAFLCGLLNPYGYKMITFIFTSYGDKYMHIYISELLPYNFGTNLGKHMFLVMGFIGALYAYFREGNVRVRYICLFLGTLLLGFMSVKGFSHFINVAFFPLAYFFKDMFPKDFSITGTIGKVLRSFIMGFTIVVLVFFSFVYIKLPQKVKLTHDASVAIDVLEKTWEPKEVTCYASFNNGGYVEFRGYKAYIDPRAEIFLKANNKKADIFKENYELQQGKIDIAKFLDKYKFTHLLVQNTDILYDKMESIDNYYVIYDNTEKGFRLYVNGSILTDEQIKNVKAEYARKVNEAKESQK